MTLDFAHTILHVPHPLNLFILMWYHILFSLFFQSCQYSRLNLCSFLGFTLTWNGGPFAYSYDCLFVLCLSHRLGIDKLQSVDQFQTTIWTQVHTFIYMFSVALFVLQQQSWIVVTNTTWSTEPCIVAKEPFAEKAYQTPSWNLIKEPVCITFRSPLASLVLSREPDLWKN
jgi:hypothetical protein